LKDPQPVRSGPQRYTRKQPNRAILLIGRNAKSTRPATTGLHKRTTGWLSSCDKWQKLTRPGNPSHLQGIADDSVSRTLMTAIPKFRIERPSASRCHELFNALAQPARIARKVTERNSGMVTTSITQSDIFNDCWRCGEHRNGGAKGDSEQQLARDSARSSMTPSRG
jgi:hypothetical protein